MEHTSEKNHWSNSGAILNVTRGSIHLNRWLKRDLMQYVNTSILHFEDVCMSLNLFQSALVRAKVSLM